MFKPNPTLFEPIKRVENAARRAMNIAMLVCAVDRN
jgi:hypothetical protein